MEWVALAAVVMILAILGATAAVVAGYQRRMSRPVPPYQLHRARWEKTGDTAELDEMIKAVEKGEK